MTETTDEFTEIVSFEGPDGYWSIEIIDDPDTETSTAWICNPDGPLKPITTGIGRWESYEHSSHESQGAI